MSAYLSPENDPLGSTEPGFTDAARENMYETNADWQEDLSALHDGTHTEESLLAYCLDGADEDRVQGWHDYVRALVAFPEGR